MRIGLRLRQGVIVGAVGFCTLAIGASAQPQPARATQLARFTVVGNYKWRVPAGVTKVTFDVVGGSGGNAVDGSVLIARGGAGGHTRATFTVKPGRIFHIAVGGPGSDGSDTQGTTATGAFAGGGNGGVATDGYAGGGGGGGESDVRVGGRGNNCAFMTGCSIYDRIVVAAGGGGAADISGGTGGNGGGIKGAPGGPALLNGEPGSQTAAGAGDNFSQFGSSYGAIGQGGNASFTKTATPPAGGGGGGWYGGGAISGNGGGGGSSYVSQFAVSGSFLASTNYGTGSVTITTT